MRRMSISLDDQAYQNLVDVAANEARTLSSRPCISKTLQKIILVELARLSYYPPRNLGKMKPLVEARIRKQGNTHRNKIASSLDLNFEKNYSDFFLSPELEAISPPQPRANLRSFTGDSIDIHENLSYSAQNIKDME
jgi:hypothetical protein